MTDFKETLAKGSKGESYVISVLRERGYEVRDFTDYSKYEYKQKKGIDGELLNKKTGEWDSFDVKSNIRPSNLFLIELYKKNSNPGWLYQSKSSWIFHHSLISKDIFVYSLSEMRNWIMSRDSNYKVRQVKNGAYGTWVHTSHRLLKKL